MIKFVLSYIKTDYVAVLIMDGTHSQVTLQLDFVNLQYRWGLHRDLELSRLVLVYLVQKTLYIWKFDKLYHDLHYSKAELVWLLSISNTCPKREAMAWTVLLSTVTSKLPLKRSSFLETKPHSTTDSEETKFLFCQALIASSQGPTQD